jgi:hypothetical protein
VVVQRQRAARTLLLLVGGTGTAGRHAVPRRRADGGAPWWFTFLVDDCGERLEMTQLMRRRPSSGLAARLA